MRPVLFITTPAFSLNGGIRVILEWANRLADDFDVYLRCLKNEECDWFSIRPEVKVVFHDRYLEKADLLLITSPHSIHYADKPVRAKKVVFLQMMEHLFRPKDAAWQALCRKTYTTSLPVISISQWNIDDMRVSFGRKHAVYYTGNGVNLQDFPISQEPKDGKTVLVEGWLPGNPTKDNLRIAPQVAKHLREEGYRILAYSAFPTRGLHYAEVPHEYYSAPSLPVLNSLYERATILLKASHFDARSCSPMEAMTKGTVTARAIQKGDDDLQHEWNCLRCPYGQVEPLLGIARDLLQCAGRRALYAKRCLDHVQSYSWDFYMAGIKRFLWNTLL